MKTTPKIWVISDTHFNHKGIVESRARPSFHGDRTLKKLKHRVGEDDILIHLGDVIFANQSELPRFLDFPCASKILVRGNHDTKSVFWYLKSGFDAVVDSFSLRYDGLDILFTHKPQKEFTGDLNIHGHLHTMSHREEESEWYSLDSPFHHLFSLEWVGYQPVWLKRITELYARHILDTKDRSDCPECSGQGGLRGILPDGKRCDTCLIYETDEAAKKQLDWQTVYKPLLSNE